MTALSKQLVAIAATSTHQLDLKAQKLAHGKSLLFDPKVAATQSFDSVYLICYDGFRELCTLDQRFVTFTKTLFSEQSKDQDRTQMSKKENEQLDLVLAAFLTLVGPRLLLKPAVKAVEWLIRRFRVHEYTTEITVFTFLQYHASPIFQALLSILPSALPPSCRFLSPYIKSLEAPPRRAIVYNAANTPALFTAFQGYVLSALKNAHYSSSFLAFWSSVTTQSVDANLEHAKSGRKDVQDQRIQELLLRILPFLNECLQFSNIPEAMLGCYSIISVVVTKTTLEDKVLDSFMEAVSASQQSDTLDDCLLCLAIIADQRSSLVLPQRVTTKLSRVPRLENRISALMGRYNVGRLALGCALAAVDNIGRSGAFQGSKAFLDRVLDDQMFEKHQIASLLSAAQAARENNAQNASQQDLLDTVISRCHETSAADQTLRAGLGGDDDVVMEEVEAAPGRTPSAPPPCLPSINDSSFLHTPFSASFKKVALAFVRVVVENHDINAFLALSDLQQDKANASPLFLSFLIRIWSGTYPVSVRQAALQSAKTCLRRWGSKCDFQLLIPYLVYALSDVSLPIRRAAAECIIELTETMAGTPILPTILWGTSELYKADSISELPPQRTLKFLSTVLLPIVEECTMDHKYATSNIKNLLVGSSHGTPDINSTERASFVAFFASNAVVTPLLRVRLHLLSFFDVPGKQVASVRVSLLLPVVREWCSLPQQNAAERCENEELDIEEVDRAFVSILFPRESESIMLLKDIICGSTNKDRQALREAAFDRLRGFWPSVKSEFRVELATSLLDLALEELKTPNDAEKVARARARETLRDVKLSTPALVSLLNSVPHTLRMPEGPPASKRRRTSRSEMSRVDAHPDMETSRTLRKLTLVLEIIEASNPGAHPELFKGLFAFLAELHQLKQQSGSSLVYLQSMILGSLLPIVNTLKETQNASDYRSSIRADLLTDCIRNSSSPQVQNGATLVVASLASWEPELVLHNLMPIFTFIGTTLLRQKDDYSAHVVDQTISRVVPQLAASLRARNRDFLAGVADLLFSFTAAFEHIPPDRRLELFCQLARTLGPEDSLSAIIAILVDKYAESETQRKFVSELLRQFEPIIAIKSLHGYLELVRDAVRPKRTVSDILFGLSEKEAAQVDLSIGNLLTNLVDLTKDKPLRKHIGKAFRTPIQQEEPRTIFARIVETTVHISQQVAEKVELYEACSKALSSCLDLLPTADLIKSAELLASSASNVHVRAAAIKAIEVRTRRIPHDDNEAASAVLGFLSKIQTLIQTSDEAGTKLIALSCVDQIIEKFGKKDAPAVMSIGRVIAGTHLFASDDNKLRILSLVCFTTMVEVVGEEFISLLPIMLPMLFKYLGESITSDSHADLYKAVYTLLTAIVEHLGFMFTVDHLEESLRLSLQSSAAGLGEECDSARHQFYHALAKQMDANNVFTAIRKTWPEAVQQSNQALQEELELLLLTIENQSRPKIVKASSGLFGLLLDVFDLRSQCTAQDKISSEDVDGLEDTMNQAVISMTLKLNDTTFRPFFIQLVDWLGASKKNKMLRATTFYRFLAEFFDRFKSIVTSYANHIIDDVSKTLAELSTKEDRLGLRTSILSALQRSFQHDQDGFWQAPSHFSTILSPLLRQLTMDSPSALSESIIPAITELAASASSLENHKEMNSILLKLMRSEEAHTRLAAVKCEQSLTQRLGEEWLGLLAEMLPFISELREDDDEMVERETQKWINAMEKILGEDLEAMLS